MDGTSKATRNSDPPLMSDAQQREKLEISWLGAFLTFHTLIVSDVWVWRLSFTAHYQKTGQQCNSRVAGDFLGLPFYLHFMLSGCQT